MIGILKMRKERLMTQEELANKVNVKANTISQYELSKRTPNAIMLKKIAQALECKVDDLLKEK